MKVSQLVLLVISISLAFLSISYAAESELKVMTYNVWFDKATAAQRIPVILDIIVQQRPEIVAIQEAESWLLDYIEDDTRLNEYHLIYKRSWQDYLLGTLSGSLLLMTKLSINDEDITFQELPSAMNRGLLTTKVQVNKTKLCLATVHLESMLEDTEIRIEQMSLIEQYHSSCKHLILLGDFNFGDTDPENNKIPAGYIDVWKKLRTNEPGYTWNKKLNPYAETNSFAGENSRRLDRIFIKGYVIKAKSIEIIGNKSFFSVRGEIFPSDHFALLSTLKIISVDHISAEKFN